MQDVLFGKGALILRHPGNQYYGSLVDAQKPKFRAVERGNKRAIAFDIMQQIHNLQPPGRFLIEEKTENHRISSNDNHDDGDNEMRITMMRTTMMMATMMMMMMVTIL